jgi:hypothetical protein
MESGIVDLQGVLAEFWCRDETYDFQVFGRYLHSGTGSNPHSSNGIYLNNSTKNRS